MKFNYQVDVIILSNGNYHEYSTTVKGEDVLEASRAAVEYYSDVKWAEDIEVTKVIKI